MEPGDRIPTHARRALSLALLALQLVVFTLGAALAGQSQVRAGAGGHALVMARASSADGAARPAASSAPGIEQVARARGDRGDRGGAAPPLDLALPPDFLAIAPASLAGSLDWRWSARDHRPSPSVVNGARGPPPT